MTTYPLRSTALTVPTRGTRPAIAFGVCLAVGLGNDIVFNAIRGSQAIYLVDYALKALMLFLALKALPEVPTVAARRIGWPLRAGVLFVCIAAGILSIKLETAIDPAWRLFEWPALPSNLYRGLDLTAGLLLNAAAEELAYRRLALAVLPFGPRGNLLAAALLFGLIHWGGGPGNVLGATICGLCWGPAYHFTGSLALVIAAHYLVDVWAFW